MLRAMAVAAAILTVSPALAETAIVGFAAARTETGPRFEAVVGVPEGFRTVGDGALQTDTMYIFPERQGVTLKAALRGDAGTVPAGTTVDSFYLCVDTAAPATRGSVRGGAAYGGRVQFDNADLLTIILRPSKLAASAEVLGRPDVTYANSRLEGVDPFWMGQDSQTANGDEFTFVGRVNGVDCRRLVFRSKG